MTANNTKNALILVAAGKGARFGSSKPKQYVDLVGKPIVQHTLDCLLRRENVFDHIIIVVADKDPYIADIVAEYDQPISIVTGGSCRTQSVKNGLIALKGLSPDNVYIHDAARPFVSNNIIQSLKSALKTSDAAVPALPLVDAIKSTDGQKLTGNADRDMFRRVQTPQAFKFDSIWPCFERLDSGETYADDIAIALENGLSITMVDGDDNNFKITHPEDLKKAENLMMKSSTHYFVTGQGYDVHQVEAGSSLWLCGVEIEADFSLKGHSDADVGLHALTDAILGAIAFGDIGDHFPPSDPQWKGARSDQFLEFAIKAVKDRGGTLCHVDVTLICEKPKVKPHREAMRQKLADICSLPLNRVSVKATTTEKLGFTGRHEGIAAQAVATVKLRETAE